MRREADDAFICSGTEVSGSVCRVLLALHYFFIALTLN